MQQIREWDQTASILSDCIQKLIQIVRIKLQYRANHQLIINASENLILMIPLAFHRVEKLCSIRSFHPDAASRCIHYACHVPLDVRLNWRWNEKIFDFNAAGAAVRVWMKISIIYVLRFELSDSGMTRWQCREVNQQITAARERFFPPKN